MRNTNLKERIRAVETEVNLAKRKFTIAMEPLVKEFRHETGLDIKKIYMSYSNIGPNVPYLDHYDIEVL